MPLAEQLADYVRACFTGIWIQSHEHEDALRDIARLCHQENWRLATWDIDRGLRLPDQPAASGSGSGGDPLAAIRALNTLAGEDTSALKVQFTSLANSSVFLSVMLSSTPPIRLAKNQSAPALPVSLSAAASSKTLATLSVVERLVTRCG